MTWYCYERLAYAREIYVEIHWTVAKPMLGPVYMEVEHPR